MSKAELTERTAAIINATASDNRNDNVKNITKNMEQETTATAITGVVFVGVL